MINNAECQRSRGQGPLQQALAVSGMDQGGRSLNQRDLRRNAAAYVQRYRLATEGRARQPILRGYLATEQLQPGLQLHLVDAQILQAFAFEAQLEPCIKLSVVLHGCTALHYGSRRLTLGPGFRQRQPAETAVASVIALGEPEGCAQQAEEGDIRRSLTLSLMPQWLERQGLDTAQVKRFANDHLRTLAWHLPTGIGVLAEQLFGYTALDPAARLVREGVALTLAGLLLDHLNGAGAAGREQSVDSRQGRRLRALLDSGEADLLSLLQIGERLGMSAATLQRHARQSLGMSLQRYLRRRRLEQAYRVLVAQQASIAEAAQLAGYAHPANFATAFRREFGLCPTAVAVGKRQALGV